MKFANSEEQGKTRDREIENADKQLSALLIEYQKVHGRVEQVRNPSYLSDILEQAKDLES